MRAIAFDLSFSVILHPSNFACKQSLKADSGLCHVIRYGNVVAYSAAVMNLTGPDPQRLFHTMGVPSTPSLTLDAEVFDLAGTQVTAGMILFAPLCPTLSHCIVSNCASCTQATYAICMVVCLFTAVATADVLSSPPHPPPVFEMDQYKLT